MEPSAVRKVKLETEQEQAISRGLNQAANTNSTISRVERDVDQPVRPRDAALRAASDARKMEVVRNDGRQMNPNYPTIDQQFSESYDEQAVGQTLMAQRGGEDQPRKSGEYRSRVQDKTQRRPARGQEAPSLNSQTTRRKSLNPRKAIQNKLLGARAGGKMGSLVDRVFATEVTVSILSWGAWVWIVLQVPLAIMAIIFFNLAIVWEGAKGGIIGSIVSTVASALSGVINALTGLDINAFNPVNFFLLTNSATMFVGWCTMLAMGLIYTVSGLPALSGKGVTAKYLTFILGLFGYFVPVLNILPWAIFWAMTVWYYPTDTE